jgi:hypothetical protein
VLLQQLQQLQDFLVSNYSCGELEMKLVIGTIWDYLNNVQ